MLTIPRLRELAGLRQSVVIGAAAYYACYGPTRSSTADLAWAAGSRAWHVVRQAALGPELAANTLAHRSQPRRWMLKTAEHERPTDSQPCGRVSVAGRLTTFCQAEWVFAITRPHVFEPTEEQQRAREVFAAGRDLALVAGAGTGKTSTLALMAASAGGRGLYLAFNRATAKLRTLPPGFLAMSSAGPLTFRATGREYHDRLNSAARIPNMQTARLLGITRDIAVDSSRITQAQQARLVTGMSRKFCHSNDTEVTARHMEPVNGLPPLAADYVARVLLRYAVRAWDDICSPDGRLRFEHDHYLKMWALTRPVLVGDFVLLDEAQDTNPVLEIFLSQDAQRVCVGDPAQQIYAWRSARDVMTGFRPSTWS